ncbi:hypothetical protein [Stygiolobus caldivivus]|nr:hypothetical protein [Stygiolobus caldivivus]
MESQLGKIFQQNKYNRDKFISEAINIIIDNTPKLKEVREKITSKKYIHYIYYAIPIDTVEVSFVRNNWVPPKAIILKGKVRFTFMPHESFSELENSIKVQNEDDIIVEFEDGLVKNFNRKRNIFTDFRNTSEVLQSGNPVIVNLAPTLNTFLLSSVIANNVYPWINRVRISRKDETLEYEILTGKAEKDEVVNGITIDPQSKAEMYYDYKTGKKLDKNEVINAIVYKLPGV